MNCANVRDRIEAYLDGDLAGEEAAAMRTHLEGCGGCRRDHDRSLATRARVTEMPREIEPPRDLWPEIRERIRHGRAAEGPAGIPPAGRSSWQGWAAAAAATALALLGLWGAGIVPPESGAPRNPASFAGAVPAAGATDLASFEVQFDRTREALLADLELRRGTLDAETVEIVLDNLRTMERAADEIRRALANDPGNPTLQHLLLASYRRQVGLLQNVNRIPTRM